jgi:ribosome biogenesis GTPase A
MNEGDVTLGIMGYSNVGKKSILNVLKNNFDGSNKIEIL